MEWGETAKQIASKDGLLTITRDSGLIRFRTEYKKSLGGRYYLDETLTKLIGRDFEKRSGNMIAVRYTSEEKESPKLEKILKHLYGNGVEFRKVPAEDRQYSLQDDTAHFKIVLRNLSKYENKPICVTKTTPFVLQRVGASKGCPITITANVIKKAKGLIPASDGTYHNPISDSELEKLPKELYNPIMIFRSQTHPETSRVV